MTAFSSPRSDTPDAYSQARGTFSGASCDPVAAGAKNGGRVVRHWLSAPDRCGDYLVNVFVPACAPPANGFPAVVLLDGDSVARFLTAEPLASESPVLTVTVGYGLEGDALKAARAFDYTPGAIQPDPRSPQWRNGGGASFVAWLAQDLRQMLSAAYPVDQSSWTLAGHSYGGLCALWALSLPDALFHRYVAASPSVWWRDGAIHAALDARFAHGPLHADVLIMAGEKEAWHAKAVGADGSPETRTGGWSTFPSAQALAARIHTVNQGLTQFSAISDGTHATMATQFIAPAIAFAATPLASRPLRCGPNNIRQANSP